MIFLDDQDRASLKIQHKKKRDGRIRDRIKAILLYDKGWTSQQIAEALLISDLAVRSHIEEYMASSKLKPKNGGSEEKLSKWQSDQLEYHSYRYIIKIVEMSSAKMNHFDPVLPKA